MSLVPLPWCTSQSRISTRSAPCAERACAAASATLLKKQKPIARATPAWWPGGRSADTPHGSPSRSSASTSATAPPAERSAASYVPATADVSRSIAPPPRADSAATMSTCSGGCTRASSSRVARGASTRSQPNQSWRSISASSATIRAGRSGWPGMS